MQGWMQSCARFGCSNSLPAAEASFAVPTAASVTAAAAAAAERKHPAITSTSRMCEGLYCSSVQESDHTRTASPEPPPCLPLWIRQAMSSKDLRCQKTTQHCYTHLSLLLLRSCLWCLSRDLDLERRECRLRLLSLSRERDRDLRGIFTQLYQLLTIRKQPGPCELLQVACRVNPKLWRRMHFMPESRVDSRQPLQSSSRAVSRARFLLFDCRCIGSPCQETGNFVRTRGRCWSLSLPKAWLLAPFRATPKIWQVGSAMFVMANESAS